MMAYILRSYSLIEREFSMSSFSKTLLASAALLCLSLSFANAGGENDPVMTRAQVRQMKNSQNHPIPDIPEDKSRLLADVEFCFPSDIARNRFFIQADAVADQDKTRAAQWLISILHEEANGESFNLSHLCADACRALIHIHAENAKEHTGDPTAQLNSLMYAGLSADIAALSRWGNRMTSGNFAFQATMFYKQAYQIAQAHGLNPYQMTVLKRVLDETEAETTTIPQRLYDLRGLFGSSRSHLETIHMLNLLDLASLGEAAPESVSLPAQ
jgi:hypothetical protein